MYTHACVYTRRDRGEREREMGGGGSPYQAIIIITSNNYDDDQILYFVWLIIIQPRLVRNSTFKFFKNFF